MKKIVVFTGAGVSADSGLATFRDSDGLWANYRIEEVCTPEALAHDRASSPMPATTPLPSWSATLRSRW